MTSRHTNAGGDPTLEVAREGAEGYELFADPTAEGRRAARYAEDAEGIAMFANPDAIISPVSAHEGDSGHEAITAEGAGFDVDADEYRPMEDEREG